ncbi:MAG TPA: alpha/beta fold hydrolase, partial [Thermoanaerobaculia bacterium]|nr:alpha/beta fold hydrolase [Thermoanaerobaculia bacterium]
MRRSLACLPLALLLAAGSAAGGPAPSAPPAEPAPAAAPAPAQQAEAPGVRRIPVTTPAGTFEVWTRLVGASDEIAVLLLHGGPGVSHEYLEIFAEHLPPAGIETIFYDQLGSHFSDQPRGPQLWEIPRFVAEVEQVRRALAHPEHLRGLVISNMMSSIPAYNRYAHEVLMPQMDPAVLAEVQALEAAERYDDPRYLELLVPHHYVHHVLRRPPAEWPDAVNRAFAPLNADIYLPMQGPSELRRERQARRLGPQRRPRPHRRADAGHRRRPRHHGPGAHGMDGRAAAAGDVPRVRRGEPPGDVGRHGLLLRGAARLARLAARRRVGPPQLTRASAVGATPSAGRRAPSPSRSCHRFVIDASPDSSPQESNKE